MAKGTHRPRHRKGKHRDKTHLLLLGGEVRVLQQRGHSDHAVHRRADLVRHVAAQTRDESEASESILAHHPSSGDWRTGRGGQEAERRHAKAQGRNNQTKRRRQADAEQAVTEEAGGHESLREERGFGLVGRNCLLLGLVQNHGCKARNRMHEHRVR